MAKRENEKRKGMQHQQPLCPCTSGLPYAMCCAPLHQLQTEATTAEQLMRSRYSAYVLADAAYLQRTWHVSTQPALAELQHSLQQNQLQHVQWLGLRIVHTTAPSEHEHTVEFIARLRAGGQKAERLHEVSRFIYEADTLGVPRWFYVDGVFPEHTST